MPPEKPDWLQRDRIIFDACCVMTVFATSRVGEILQSISPGIVVSLHVAEKEALFIFSGPDDNPRATRTLIDLTPLDEAGLIEIVRMERNAEIESFISLSASLDDGEAETLAIALSRDWAVATDDKRAMRIGRDLSPDLPIVTTPELIKHWADAADVPVEEVAQSLKSIRWRSVYLPPRKHPLFDWWISHVT